MARKVFQVRSFTTVQVIAESEQEAVEMIRELSNQKNGAVNMTATLNHPTKGSLFMLATVDARDEMTYLYEE